MLTRCRCRDTRTKKSEPHNRVRYVVFSHCAASSSCRQPLAAVLRVAPSFFYGLAYFSTPFDADQVPVQGHAHQKIRTSVLVDCIACSSVVAIGLVIGGMCIGAIWPSFGGMRRRQRVTRDDPVVDAATQSPGQSLDVVVCAAMMKINWVLTALAATRQRRRARGAAIRLDVPATIIAYLDRAWGRGAEEWILPAIVVCSRVCQVPGTMQSLLNTVLNGAVIISHVWNVLCRHAFTTALHRRRVSVRLALSATVTRCMITPWRVLPPDLVSPTQFVALTWFTLNVLLATCAWWLHRVCSALAHVGFWFMSRIGVRFCFLPLLLTPVTAVCNDWMIMDCHNPQHHLNRLAQRRQARRSAKIRPKPSRSLWSVLSIVKCVALTAVLLWVCTEYQLSPAPVVAGLLLGLVPLAFIGGTAIYLGAFFVAVLLIVVQRGHACWFDVTSSVVLRLLSPPVSFKVGVMVDQKLVALVPATLSTSVASVKRYLADSKVNVCRDVDAFSLRVGGVVLSDACSLNDYALLWDGVGPSVELHARLRGGGRHSLEKKAARVAEDKQQAEQLNKLLRGAAPKAPSPPPPPTSASVPVPVPTPPATAADKVAFMGKFKSAEQASREAQVQRVVAAAAKHQLKRQGARAARSQAQAAAAAMNPRPPPPTTVPSVNCTTCAAAFVPKWVRQGICPKCWHQSKQAASLTITLRAFFFIYFGMLPCSSMSHVDCSVLQPLYAPAQPTGIRPCTFRPLFQYLLRLCLDANVRDSLLRPPQLHRRPQSHPCNPLQRRVALGRKPPLTHPRLPNPRTRNRPQQRARIKR